MKFLLHGRAGKYLLREEIFAPTLEAAREEANRRVNKHLEDDPRFGFVSVELHLRLPEVWHRNNQGEGYMSRNGIFALLEEEHPAA